MTPIKEKSSLLSLAERVRCEGCGRFIGVDQLAEAEFHFTPLNEFGPEEADWTCAACLRAISGGKSE